MKMLSLSSATDNPEYSLQIYLKHFASFSKTCFISPILMWNGGSTILLGPVKLWWITLLVRLKLFWDTPFVSNDVDTLYTLFYQDH